MHSRDAHIDSVEPVFGERARERERDRESTAEREREIEREREREHSRTVYMEVMHGVVPIGRGIALASR